MSEYEHVGAEQEVHFWNWVMDPENNHKHYQAVLNRFDPAKSPDLCPLYVRDLIDRLENPFSLVMDMGCGPASLLWYARTLGHRLIGVDLLVCEYMEIMKKYNLKPLHTMIPAAMEDWEALRPFAEEADLVYSRNALDHANDPWTCVTNMVSLVKPGGDLFIQVYYKEGQRGEYRGMHQTDIWIEDDGQVMCAYQNGVPSPLDFGHLTPVNVNQVPELHQWVNLHYKWIVEDET